MSYLAILECPVTFSAENKYSMSSIDMCPTVGITRGLVSRHVKVVDARILVVCIWESQSFGQTFFDAEWHAKAGELWGEDYQLRLASPDASQVA